MFRLFSAHDAAVFRDQPLAVCSDRGLLVRFGGGEQSAFAELMHRHAPLVEGVCRRVLGASSDVDDAFQATFLVLAKRAAAGNWEESIAGWLHETARRTALKVRGAAARRKRREQAVGAESARTADDPARQATVRELAELLDEELAALPDKFREVVVLSQIEGLGRDEIAQRLSIAPAAVKDRLERGRERLRARLLRRGVTLTSAALAAWLAPTAAQAAASYLVASTVPTAAAFAAGQVSFGGSLSAAVALAQGVLKTMAWQKLKSATAWCLAIATAGGVAYGVLRDDERRLEQGLRGHVVEVVHAPDRRAVTVRLDEFDVLLSLDVDPRVQVWNAYESRDFDDLRTGQYVAFRLADDHRTIRELHIVGDRRLVRIDELGPDGLLVVTDVDDDDDQTPPAPQRYRLVDGAILRIGGLPATRVDVRVGMIVPLELSADGRSVHAIEAEAEPDSMLEGEVRSVDAAEPALVVVGEDERDVPFERRLPLSGGALLRVDGRTAAPAEVRPGAAIRLRLAPDRRSIRAANVTNPEPEVDDDAPAAAPAA